MVCQRQQPRNGSPRILLSILLAVAVAVAVVVVVVVAVAVVVMKIVMKLCNISFGMYNIAQHKKLGTDRTDNKVRAPGWGCQQKVTAATDKGNWRRKGGYFIITTWRLSKMRM